ncbi:MAG: NAD-dependent deacylase [Gemmatimonadales bacterium]|nr:MAG: NAD-dependent deacylase [Gemmatimonadales bacterium]
MGHDRRDQLTEAAQAIREAKEVVILTGAGVSAESGIPTFRDAMEGLWSRYRPEELATPEAFRRDPALVWRWYDMRRRGVVACRPNPAHEAVAHFLRERSSATLVTQNVDGLHQRALAGAWGVASGDVAELPESVRVRILTLHGDILAVRCVACDYLRPDQDPVAAESDHVLPRCPQCDQLLRPAVVWFGEMLDGPTLEAAFEAAARADICVVAGTSAVVHPAASIPEMTLRSGGRLVEVNPARTPLSGKAYWRVTGSAGEVLPTLLATG